MSFWNIFKDFVTTDKGQVINKVGDDTWLDQCGTVFRKLDNIITGSDGSIHNMVRCVGSDDGAMSGMAIKTSSGFGGDDGF